MNSVFGNGKFLSNILCKNTVLLHRVRLKIRKRFFGAGDLVIVQSEKRAEGAPWIIFGIMYHARLYRIQMDVAAGLQEIGIILDQTGFIAPLKQMPGKRVLPVVVLCIAVRKLLDKFPNRNVAGSEYKDFVP